MHFPDKMKVERIMNNSPRRKRDENVIDTSNYSHSPHNHVACDFFCATCFSQTLQIAYSERPNLPEAVSM